jgi:hypothetical protein
MSAIGVLNFISHSAPSAPSASSALARVSSISLDAAGQWTFPRTPRIERAKMGREDICHGLEVSSGDVGDQGG